MKELNPKVILLPELFEMQLLWRSQLRLNP